jgi:tetratricopeptide (TPR) repeat protein
MLERLMRSRVGLLAIVLGFSALSCAQGQEVDESALRYYAAQGQTQRVEAEARRLSDLHPGWSMPEDIWSARLPMGDEEPLWALFTAGDLDRLKRAIHQRQIAEPGWLPSDDLLRKLKFKELRVVILGKAAKSQWHHICDLAADQLKGGISNDAELSWIVAEAYARCDRMAEAKAMLSRVLQRSGDANDRRTTMLKALALLPMRDVEELLDMGRKNEADASEFAELGNDLTRARMVALLRGEREGAIDPTQLAAFETSAEMGQGGETAELIAWFAFRENRLDAALKWFQLARARSGDSSSAHGLAQVLWRLGKVREAEDIAFNSRESVPANMILFVDMFEAQLTQSTVHPPEAARLLRYAKVTMEARSGEGAQALGWYAYKSCQFETALDWFRRASAWLPRETTILGQALSLQRLKKQRDYTELVNRYDGLFPTVVGLAFKDGSEAFGGVCSGPDKREPSPSLKVADWKGKRSALQVPQPGNIHDQRVDASRQFKAKDFPIAVAPENPLRFPEPAGAKTKLTVARPPDPDQRPLIARRVSGVVVMPYEQPDWKLSPSWNGESGPSLTSSVDSAPAQGTIASQIVRLAPYSASASGGMDYGVSASGGQAVATRLRR